jgi:hypothetical protein
MIDLQSARWWAGAWVDGLLAWRFSAETFPQLRLRGGDACRIARQFQKLTKNYAL